MATIRLAASYDHCSQDIDEAFSLLSREREDNHGNPVRPQVAGISLGLHYGRIASQFLSILNVSGGVIVAHPFQ